VLAYALLLAEKHHLDIFDIVLRKIRKNGEKYPVEKARGTAKKYNELGLSTNPRNKGSGRMYSVTG